MGRISGWPRIAAEVACLTLMLASVGGTCALIVLAHRRASDRNVATPSRAVAVSNPEPALVEVDGPALEQAAEVPSPAPQVPPEPTPPALDPMAPRLAELAERRDELERRRSVVRGRVDELRSERDALEEAAASALAEGAEAKLRGASIASEADRLEAEMQLAGLERDVLERRLDRVEREHREAIANPGYAILPYRGPSGTWRRPIAIECANGSATIMPGGLSFSMLDLMTTSGRSGPLGAAVKTIANLLAREGAPDGSAVEPYVVFVVRPDGIRPFYEARTAMEAADVPYGYELVDQDWAIEYPSWDDPTIWGPVAEAVASARSTPRGPLGSGTESAGPDRSGSGPPGGLGDRAVGAPFPPPPPTPADLLETFRRPAGTDLADIRGDAETIPTPRPNAGGRDGLGSTMTNVGSIAESARRGMGGGSSNLPLGGPGRIGLRPTPGNSGPVEVEQGGPTLGEGPLLAGERPLRFESEGNGGSFGASDDPGDRLDDLTVGDRANAPDGDRRMIGGSGVGGGPGSNGRGIGRSGGPVDPSAELGRTPTMAGGRGSVHGAGNAGGAGDQGIDLGIGTGGGGGGEGGGGQGTGSGGAGGRPIELVVACGPKGAVVHPGGYKLTTEALEKDPETLVELLDAVLESRRRLSPSIAAVPSVRFLVERGGRDLFWKAKAQVELSGRNWPTSWVASEPRTFALFGSERW